MYGYRIGLIQFQCYAISMKIETDTKVLVNHFSPKAQPKDQVYINIINKILPNKF